MLFGSMDRQTPPLSLQSLRTYGVMPLHACSQKTLQNGLVAVTPTTQETDGRTAEVQSPACNNGLLVPLPTAAPARASPAPVQEAQEV
jgi:hypothetical protein